MTDNVKNELTSYLMSSFDEAMIVYNDKYKYTVTEKELNDICLEIMPFSIGLEVEAFFSADGYSDSKRVRCEIEKLLNGLAVDKIIMAYRCHTSETSVRFHKGLKGLQGIQEFSKILMEYYLWNNLAGTHFHVDFTDCPESVKLGKGYNKSPYFEAFKEYDIEVESEDNKSNIVSKTVENFILEELDLWEYSGTYNQRVFLPFKGGWCCYRQYVETMEVRCGNMFFTYHDLIEKVNHLGYIFTVVKQAIKSFDLFEGKHYNTATVDKWNKETIKNRKIKIEL
jgi:hypothetical protein